MPLWLAPQPLVLASKSDVRGKMLAAAGLRFEIRPAQIDERAVEAKAGVTDAAAVARMLARAKADAVAQLASRTPGAGRRSDAGARQPPFQQAGRPRRRGRTIAQPSRPHP